MAQVPAAPSPSACRHTPIEIRASEFEITLGARLPSVRAASKMSLTAPGEGFGISFQQAQRRGFGKGRVAASTLQGIAAASGVCSISSFDERGPVLTSPTSDVKNVIELSRAIQRDRAFAKRPLAR